MKELIKQIKVKIMKELIERAIQINEELVARLKELEELEEPNLLGADGKYFTCERKDIKIKGRIRVENSVCLCQDEVDGFECKEKYGYKYSYFIKKGTEDDLEWANVKHLKLWDYLPKEGEYFYVKTKEGYAFIAIAKNGEDLTSRFISLNQDNGRLNDYDLESVCSEPSIKELRSATTEEITLLDTKLKENGKYFDQATMSIKDIVKPDKPNNPEVGDLCIFWNYEKTDAVIGKLTEIKNKSIISYEVGSMWSYMHCIKFESIEQYNEFIEE